MNTIKCKNCSAENPFFELICRNCRAYIRERIFNIDFFHTATLIIESPIKAFRLIIHSEHKNFVLIVSILASVKLLLNTMMLSVATTGTDYPFGHFFRNLLISAAVLLILIVVISFLTGLFLNVRKTETRFKDNFSIISFSFMPHIFGLLILFPIELVIFGGFLFSNNPSPFMLKQTIAYFLLGFEMLLILWQIFLSTAAFTVQTGNVPSALWMSIIFNALLYYILYLSSYLII